MEGEPEEFIIRRDQLTYVMDILKSRPYEEVHIAMLFLEQLPMVCDKDTSGGEELLEG